MAQGGSCSYGVLPKSCDAERQSLAEGDTCVLSPETPVGTVTAVDTDARTVTIRGVERTVVLEVSEEIDLDTISVGDDVNALFQESIAISVEPAPAGE